MSRIGPRDTRTSPRAEDWRDQAACRTEDPEIFFASEVTAEGKAAIRHAKVICWRCPVMEACGQWAFAERVPFGVFGGVSEGQRRAILRRRGIKLLTDTEPDEPRTFHSLYQARTVPLDGGHLGWTGSTPIHCEGSYHSPAQISFRMNRGRPPVGVLRRTCPVAGCVLGEHLRDQQDREEARERAVEMGLAT